MAKQSSTSKVHTRKHVARLERERKQISIILWISITAIAVVLGLVGYGLLYDRFLKLRQPVAEVNGEKITLGYWQERMQLNRLDLLDYLQTLQYYQQFGMDTSQQQQQVMFQLQSGEILGDQILTQLINEALIRQEAQKRGITVSDQEVNERLQGTFDFYPNGTQTPTITPTDFSHPTLTNEQLTLFPPVDTPTAISTSTPAPTATQDLSVTPIATFTPAPATPTSLPQLPTATATPYTLDGFNKQYADALKNIKNNFNISEATLRSKYENQIYAEKLIEEIAKDTPRTEEQVWARHILAPDDATLGIVRSLLLTGWDFGKVAQKYSSDTGSGANGGDLGWFGKGQMVPEFESAAYSQAIGEIGEPVKSQYGYHIIQVIAREELPLSADQYAQNRQAAFDDWVTKTNEDEKTTGTITTFDDVWRSNVPEMPASALQFLQQ